MAATDTNTPRTICSEKSLLQVLLFVFLIAVVAYSFDSHSFLRRLPACSLCCVKASLSGATCTVAIPFPFVMAACSMYAPESSSAFAASLLERDGLLAPVNVSPNSNKAPPSAS